MLQLMSVNKLTAFSFAISDLNAEIVFWIGRIRLQAGTEHLPCALVGSLESAIASCGEIER